MSIEKERMYMHMYICMGIGIDGWIEIRVRVNPHI